MTKSPKFPRRLGVLAMVLALVAIAAACGGDDPEIEGGGFEGDDPTPSADDGGGGGDAAGDDGSADDDGGGDGDGDTPTEDGFADPDVSPTPATASTLPDPLPAPSLDIGQPTSEDAVFLYVAAELGVAYVGDCRNLDPADYDSGTYCSVKEGDTYRIGQAPDVTEATIVVVEGDDGWVVESATLG